MQLGAVFSNSEVGASVSTIRDWAQGLEDLGYDFAVVSDHVVGADPAAYPELPRVFSVDTRVHEPLTLFAFLAGAAPKLGFLSSVVILPQRQTALVAKQAAEVDVLSEGKLRLGVGIGWNPVEFTALGEKFSNRARRFEEQVAALRDFWTERTVTLESRYHDLKAVGVNPLPVQRPIPIWIGASAEAAVKRACAIGDGYLPLAPLEGGWQATIDKIHGWLQEAGRDPRSFGIEGRLNAASGTPDEWARTVEMWRGFGASHLSVGTQGLGGVEAHLKRLREVREIVGNRT
ncbi:MAG TPA: LLM class F420-dependent oxidoreductase [Chloroflexota bacterium]|nr:LLM class F420-dependent oxidoreductase [Chloroflexota bacterium]